MGDGPGCRAWPVLVLLFFLRSFSSTLIIAIAIPISVISTFALMFFNGFTLNTISFGGLALGVGMLVDNAIVVLENVYRHREDGKSHLDAAMVGSREVSTAITASTLTTIAVFVPVLFLAASRRRCSSRLAYVVSFALLCSLAVALLVVPGLCAKLARRDACRQTDRATPPVGSRLAARSGCRLRWALAVVLGEQDAGGALCGAAVRVSIYLAPYLGVELQPEVDEGEVRVSVEWSPARESR